MRARAGSLLRRLANRVDPDGALAASGLSFTFEDGRGFVLRGEPGVHKMSDRRDPGCELLYIRREYDRAHTQSGREGGRTL